MRVQDVKVVYDPHVLPGTAYMLDPSTLVMYRPLSERTWWKPWTWKRHVLTLSEMWGQ